MKKIFNNNGQPSANTINAFRRSQRGDIYRPTRWINNGRVLQDDSDYIKGYLTAKGIMFECGNDAPRGGKDGNYIKPAQQIVFS